ncbi:MAG: hypothetical protein IPJ11_16885 [Gemmatimonadetes bacterium]|nr:hypothetical protein [Gemmatimonadota bacterium]
MIAPQTIEHLEASGVAPTAGHRNRGSLTGDTVAATIATGNAPRCSLGRQLGPEVELGEDQQ